MITALFIATLIAIALIAAVLVRIVRDAPDRSELARLQTRDDDYQGLLAQLENRNREYESLQAVKIKLEAELENEKRNAEEKLRLLEASEERLKSEFQNLANRIFDEKGRALNEQGRERLSNLLQPFKEQIESFRKRVDEVHKNDTEQSTRLIEQVRQLQELSNRVSEDANNLAHAIKGDSKQQGDWGEVIVERIFESSGLELGREYERQAALRDKEGTLKKPDFIIHLPQDKSVIVDSKVSLTAYERYCNTEHEEERAEALAEHIASVRKHIEELRAKDYSELLGDRTLDFVLMCIPLEPAYQQAMAADQNLIYDLGGSSVVVTGPTTLMITIRLISQIWRREKENRNAAEIARKGGLLYDKVVLVADAMSDARKKLGSVSDAFELAMRRMQDGPGNVIRKIEEIRQLGAKVSKEIPAEMLDNSDREELPDDAEGEIEDPDRVNPDSDSRLK